MNTRLGVPLSLTLIALGCMGEAFSATTNAAAQSESQIVSAFRQAHAGHRLDRLLALFCWDHVTPEIRKMTEKDLEENLKEEITVVKVSGEHPAGRSNRYIRDGVVYGPNLAVVKELVVETQVAKGNAERTYFPLGIKDGRYQIALAVPLGPADRQPQVGQDMPTALPEVDKTGEPKNHEARKKVTIPAMTPLVVHIDQEVGLNLISNGGQFTVTFAQPVQVNGVTLIPAGSRSEGKVSKTDHYSPELTLNDVTIDGQATRLRTFPITFNEKISFPAGSELSFHLMFPLEVSK